MPTATQWSASAPRTVAHLPLQLRLAWPSQCPGVLGGAVTSPSNPLQVSGDVRSRGQCLQMLRDEDGAIMPVNALTLACLVPAFAIPAKELVVAAISIEGLFRVRCTSFDGVRQIVWVPLVGGQFGQLLA